MENTINIFTLNCWGIPVVSKNRVERMEAIANYLSNSLHNIVCLQEIWSEKDYLFLKDYLTESFPYSHYFYSGVLGSGLCVFSTWVIQDIFFHQWPLNGYIHKIHHGDWFGGKGVGLCRIKCGDKLIIIYCTHLHAEYHADDIYLAHRMLQAYSTAELVNLTSSTADIAILAGDLNTAPGDLSYRLVTQLPSLLDPCALPDQRYSMSTIRASGTCDNINNSYSDPKLSKSSPDGKRIDHIMFHAKPEYEVQVLNYGNPLPDRVPNKDFSYSDHNAVMMEIKLTPSCKSKSNQRQSSYCSLLQDTISESIKVCQEAIRTTNKTKRIYLTISGLIFMFLIGTVGFWPNYLIFDLIKILITGFAFYYLIMGTLWNQIEINSLKAGLSGLTNFSKRKTS